MLSGKAIFLCIFALIATDAAVIPDSNTSDKEVNYRLPNHARPLSYDIKLNPHLVPDNFTFDGEVLIYIEILNSTKILTLNMKNLVINENETFLQTEDGLEFYVPIMYEDDNLTEFLSLGFEDDLPARHYILHLKFTGVMNDKLYGLYRNSYINEVENTVFAGADFIATYPRTAFPCWDEPAFKATFKIAIKHLPNYTAISNMPISEKSEIDKNDGKIWTHFEESPIISTHLVGFLISDLNNISNSDGTINVWSKGDAISWTSFVHEVAQKAKIEFERYTNNSIQIPKIDHVVFHARFGNINSWGLIIYRNTMKMPNKVNNFIDELYEAITHIVRQTSYQYFDNTISPLWWNNIWMNNELAEYLTYNIADKLYNDQRITEFFILKTLYSVLLTDSSEQTKALNLEPNSPEEIRSLYYWRINNKASMLFRMLSHCISDDVFHAGLLKYLNT